jgi:hypothetical protein
VEHSHENATQGYISVILAARISYKIVFHYLEVTLIVSK